MEWWEVFKDSPSACRAAEKAPPEHAPKGNGATITNGILETPHKARPRPLDPPQPVKAEAEPAGEVRTCRDPECKRQPNGDPEISKEFCCEKCEGRFNNHEWGWEGKKHTRACRKRCLESLPEVPRRKCAHGDCEFATHSYTMLTEGGEFCCKACEAADDENKAPEHGPMCEHIVFETWAEEAPEEVPKGNGATITKGILETPHKARPRPLDPPQPVKAEAEPAGEVRTCRDPECKRQPNGDPEISKEFCCEKCEGRFNNHEWGWEGKKHTRACRKRCLESLPEVPRRKCAHGDCEFATHSYTMLTEGGEFCCKACEAADDENKAPEHGPMCEHIVFETWAEEAPEEARRVKKRKGEVRRGTPEETREEPSEDVPCAEENEEVICTRCLERVKSKYCYDIDEPVCRKCQVIQDEQEDHASRTDEIEHGRPRRLERVGRPRRVEKVKQVGGVGWAGWGSGLGGVGAIFCMTIPAVPKEGPSIYRGSYRIL